jgi:membrane-bound lytic murein transglycosylase
MKVKLQSQTFLILFASVFLLSSCKTGPSNPYIDSKEKPSTMIQKGNQRQQNKAKKLSKRQLKRTKRNLGY